MHSAIKIQRRKSASLMALSDELEGKKRTPCNQGVGGVGGRSGHVLLHAEVSWEDPK
jgi:hypothetical protein